MTVKNLFLSVMMEYGIWNQIFEWEDNLENVRLVGTSFRNRHTSELKADLLGGFANFRAEMHSSVAQSWAEKAGISVYICSVRVGLYVHGSQAGCYVPHRGPELPKM